MGNTPFHVAFEPQFGTLIMKVKILLSHNADWSRVNNVTKANRVQIVFSDFFKIQIFIPFVCVSISQEGLTAISKHLKFELDVHVRGRDSPEKIELLALLEKVAFDVSFYKCNFFKSLCVYSVFQIVIVSH